MALEPFDSLMEPVCMVQKDVAEEVNQSSRQIFPIAVVVFTSHGKGTYHGALCLVLARLL